MLVLNPRNVKFGAATWSSVAAVAIDRVAGKLIEDFGDSGPYVVAADVPEQKVRVKVVQEFAKDEMNAPRPGDSAVLEFVTSPMGTDLNKRKVSMTAVVIGVDHEIGLRKGSTRTVTLTAVSGTGVADPVSIVSV
jgi:hypothetical protein